MPPLRIWVTNCLCLNGGDAAIVEATIRSLRDALDGRELDVTLLDASPSVSERLFPTLTFRPWPWHLFAVRGLNRLPSVARDLFLARAYLAAFLIGRGRLRLARPLLRRSEWRLLRDYGRADLVVSKGGTYLVEHYDLEPHLFDFRLCRLLRRPLVLGSQSLGPFRGRRTRRVLGRLLARATVFVRDERSSEHLRSLGVEPAGVVPDAAWALASAEALREARRRTLPASPSVAVSVREWRHFATRSAADGMASYTRAVEALVTHLVREHSARVTFTSTCQGVPEYWTDDSRLAAEIAGRLPADVAERTTVDAEWRAPTDLLEKLTTFDLAVATRMHFAILSLAAGVPVLPIAYEFKTSELFARLGAGGYVQDIETLTPQSLTDAADRFVADLPALREPLFDAAAVERERALEATRRIVADLGGRPAPEPTGAPR